MYMLHILNLMGREISFSDLPYKITCYKIT